MLFNSYEFIFFFLPIVFIVYFSLTKMQLIFIPRAWLILSSLVFYSWWNIIYLPLILGSLIINYFVGRKILSCNIIIRKKVYVTLGIVFNIALLGYFKYYDFFISNVNFIFDTNLPLLRLALPLAISFFTFQQIAYLVDTYRGETKRYKFLNYALFVTFFPQLIAGPIVHHSEVMDQFDDQTKKRISLTNVSKGVFIFSIGLFKKVVIADTFAVWATKGFDNSTTLTFFDGWLTSLSYTFQLYFDFSGYADMAIGAALLLNIKLPVNFNSPYKALNIQDFWRRWHMTLGRFLTNYLYIPLGGNRKGVNRTYINIMIIFLISGLWHGAGWTFIFWGFLHGLATVINRFWRLTSIKIPKLIAWFITFNFVNIAWVFFRATSWDDALKVLRGMLGLNGFALPEGILQVVNSRITLPQNIPTNFIFDSFTTVYCLAFVLMSLIVVSLMKNSIELVDNLKGNWYYALWASVAAIVSILSLHKVSEFLYFNF